MAVTAVVQLYTIATRAPVDSPLGFLCKQTALIE
jgi:hypothetical protein